MIVLIFLLIHFGICLAVFVFMKLGVLKVDSLMMVMVVCIPLWGALCAVIITVMIKLGKVGNKNGDLELMRSNLIEQSLLPRQEAESDDIVPLEDALIMNDPTVRRSVMMDVLMTDTKKYIPVINQARMNDDVEVVHYATTAMVELSKEYELKLQEYSSEYATNPGKEGLLDEYVSFLAQYISSGMVQGQLLEIQRNTYHQLLITKLTLNPNIDDYERLVKSLLDSKLYIRADVALSTMEQNWPSDERNWLLRFRYYYETGASIKLKEMIKTTSESGNYYSKEIRDIVKLWKKEEMGA
ncbi:hypothetical protein SAMN04487928_10384 [Butyrivibrio proteoclasticus]|uniref:Uncharacterized protein n=1 Tax=Butyrivibrio proteoclasticus TaxID=43305 RepID=A0A1I5R2R5_9FIRM|nr:hypothetical protein [Butyrivibrio proteoclasticus]SFP52650.1 hypothetical protein SAMN04487928_10384 [Butyrivibrio proteoclasticus]